MECVVLAAGEGRRMRPLTATRPKVMLPLANRPILEHLLAATRDAGIRDFVLVVGYREKEIRDHFGDGSRLGIRIRYVPQRHQLGTGDALREAEGLVSGTFLLLNGDMIVRREALEEFLRRPPPAMALSRSPRPEDYGVVVLEGDRVTGLDEKSRTPRSDLINAGAYLLDEGIFEALGSLSRSPRGEFELTDALAASIRAGTLRGHHLSSWMDAGYPWDLLEANREMLDRETPRREGIIEEGVQIAGSVSVGEGTVIRAGTVIEGPCAIGSGCRIGPHAYLRGATSIGDRCHIGHATEVKNSVILPETNLPHFNYVADSIVGSRCNFGAGTKIANLRHDHGEVVVCGRSTGRTKFGAVVGDGVLFGINCSVNTGTIVGAGVRVAPHAYIHGCIDDGTEIR